MLNGRLLADGGILNPIPIAPTVAAHADITLAVSLSGEYREPGHSRPVLATAAEEPVEEWSDRFRRTAAHLLDRGLFRSIMGRFASDADVAPTETLPDDLAPLVGDGRPADALPDGLSKFDVMNLSIDAMQALLNRYRLAGYPADVVVTIPRDACRTLDFHRADEMIPLGRELTAAALDRAGLTSGTGPPTEPGAEPPMAEPWLTDPSVDIEPTA